MQPGRFEPRSTEERLAVAAALLEGREPAADADGFGEACAAVFKPGPALEVRHRPLVSILICTFNRAGWLREAIDSALAQRWPVEVVVVDDGSNDDTPAVLAAYASLVRAIRHVTNTGKPGALETGVAALRGEAFLVLDDDDRLLPGALEVLAAELFADETAVLAHGDTIVFDDPTGRALDWRPACRLPAAMWRAATLTTIPALPGATLIRTAAQRRLGPFDAGLIRGQDMDHFLRLSALGHGVLVPLPVLLYRRHDGLRGSKGAQWKKHRDPAEHRRRFLQFVQPAFRQRWRESAHGRAEGFAWAVGLQERELHAEAKEEIRRWPLPATPFERWVRGRAGLESPAPVAGLPTLVVDDGADGALALLLASLPSAEGLTVVASRSHDGLAACQLFWPGQYRVERPMSPRRGLVQLRLSSAPGWAPPPVEASLLLSLPPADSVLTLALALGAPAPERSALPQGAHLHPLARSCLQALSDHPNVALAAAADLLQATPGWAPGRFLAARVCRAAGLHQEADTLSSAG